MESIALEIKLECKSCGNSIAINAMNVEFECKACCQYVKVSQGALIECYKEIIRRVVEEKDNRLKVTGSVIPFFLEGMECTRLYGRKFPVYGETQLDMETLDKHSVAGFIHIDNKKILIRKPQEGFEKGLPQVKYLVGEDEEQATHLPGDTRKKAKDGLQPILFSCLSCGGALSVDGSERILTCTYCSNSSYIPDALWLKFHPVSMVKRWYLVW